MRPAESEFARMERERMELLPCRTLCAFCEWEYLGTVLEGRLEAAEHRREAHPEAAKKRRKPGRHLGSFRQPKLKEDDRRDIYAERERRARLLGLDLSADTAV